MLADNNSRRLRAVRTFGCWVCQQCCWGRLRASAPTIPAIPNAAWWATSWCAQRNVYASWVFSVCPTNRYICRCRRWRVTHAHWRVTNTHCRVRHANRRNLSPALLPICGSPRIRRGHSLCFLKSRSYVQRPCASADCFGDSYAVSKFSDTVCVTVPVSVI
jgi:hypothetical protein